MSLNENLNLFSKHIRGTAAGSTGQTIDGGDRTNGMLFLGSKATNMING